MHRLGRAVGALFVAGTVVVAAATPARADEAKSVQVAAQEGRNVEFLVYLDPNLQPAAGGDVSSKVVISGVEVPSEASPIIEDTAPKEAILVLDVSGSMRGPRLASAKEAATNYVNVLPDDVEIGLVSFNDTVTVDVRPTLDKKAVITAIDGLEAGKKTALYDGAIAGLDLANADKGARLLLLSDGGDTASAATIEDVTARATSEGIPIDVVALTPTVEHTAVLKGIAGSSGGQFLLATDATGLNQAFDEATGSFGGKVRVTSTIPEDVDADAKFAIVTVAVGGTDFTGTTQLPRSPDLASTTGAGDGTAPTVTTPQEQTAPTESGPSTGVWLAALLGAVVVISIAVAIASWRRDRTARLRTDQVLWYSHATQTGNVGRRPEMQQGGFVDAVDKWMSKRSWYDKVDTQLDNSALSLSVGAWELIRIAITVALALVAAILLGVVWLGLLVGGLIGWLVTRAWLGSRQASHRKMFDEELPDFLLLLASALRSGLSFQQGLDSGAQEGTGEVSRQMRRALSEVQMGSTIEAALIRVSERMKSQDLRWTVTALAIQREVGGNLSNILDTAAQTIKSRAELRREVRTLSAEGRLSGWVLAALPVMIFVYLIFANRAYVSFFWTNVIGYAALAGIAILFIVGFIWVQRLVKIEV